jgi:hypothetical protein
MLRHRVLAENDTEAVTEILFQIAERGPKNVTGQTFEIAEFLERDGRSGVPADVRRLGARFGCGSDLQPRAGAARLKKKNARGDSGEEDRGDNPKSRSTFLLFSRHKTGSDNLAGPPLHFQ